MKNFFRTKGFILAGVMIAWFSPAIYAEKSKPVDLAMLGKDPLELEDAGTASLDAYTDESPGELGHPDPASEDGLFIENEYPDTKIYFNILRGDGSNEIIAVPPNSIMALPPDAFDAQFLYEEKVNLNKKIPYFVIGWEEAARDIEEKEWGPEYQVMPRPESVKYETIVPKENVADGRDAVFERERVLLVNEGSELAVVHVITKSKRRHIVIAYPNEPFELPPDSDLVGVRPYRTAQGKMKHRQEDLKIHMIKSTGDRIILHEAGHWEKVAS